MARFEARVQIPAVEKVPLIPNIKARGNGALGYLGERFARSVARAVVTPTEALLLHGTPPASQEDYLFGRKGPWPQPSPSHPLGQAPAVVHLPFSYKLDWQLNIGMRYLATLMFWWPVAAAKTAETPALAEVPDDEFDRLMTTGIYSKFLTPFSFTDEPAGPEQVVSQGPVDNAPDSSTGDVLDPRKVFSAFAPANGEGKYYVVDLTPIKGVRPYRGMYVAPTLSLVRKDARNQPGRVIAIYINDMVLTPKDGAAWRLSKYFVLQGASYGILFTIHPNIHFPYDPINAITISALPKQHLLSRLLQPHLRFSLALDDAVLQSPASVISNYRLTPYDPFTARMNDGLAAFFNAGYAGIPGNPAYPPYTYTMRPKDFASDYSTFLSAYYPAFQTFVAKVLSPENLPVGDRYVTRWARYINEWIPSFPNGDEIWEQDRLVDAVAGFLWGVSVAHAADHQVFAKVIKPSQYCLRLRLPPPSSATMPDFDRRDLSTPIDLFKAVLATKMFFEPTNITLLCDTRYDFDADVEPQLIAAQNQFLQDLRDVEASLKESGIPIYIPLDEISRSIQY
ncbi:Hypothetical protein A7982_04541 [Minicystis rosea]|nr:Hypothetical protein A7982_04541 [Minicystis rosea]